MKIDVGELYELHRSDLVRFATMLVGPSDAGDVVSDAMVAVLGSSSTAPVRDERGYLFRAVANAANSMHRSGRRRRDREVRAVAVAAPSRHDQPPAAGASVAAREVLAQLSEQQRLVVFLAYWMDLTAAQIAGMLEVNEGTVRKHLARGRERLRVLLDDREVST